MKIFITGATGFIGKHLIHKLLEESVEITINLRNKSKNLFEKCDAFSKKTLDKVGAGDTMLSLISICLKRGMTKSLSLFIGSLAAAYSVETMGNKYYVKKDKILKSIEHLLK